MLGEYIAYRIGKRHGREPQARPPATISTDDWVALRIAAIVILICVLALVASTL